MKPSIEKTIHHARYGWISGIASGVVTLVFSLLSGAGYPVIDGIDYWIIIDTALIFGLTIC